MKKRLIIFILAILTIPTVAFSKINVTVDMTPINFDVEPKILNNRTMVPMRAIFDALNADISWDDSTKTVTATKDSITIKTTIGSKEISINGKTKQIDTAPVIENSRTLVPIRFISESLGCRVSWDDNSKTVSVISNDLLQVHFIDVGQADSILLTKGDDAILIDGGNRADDETVYSYINNQGVDSLDYVFCTHGHEDHVGGLSYILENVKTDIVISDDNYDSKTFKKFISTANTKNIPIKEPNVYDTFSFNECTLEIVAPLSDNYSDYNDNSIVLRLTYDNTSFLFMGDAGFESESEILNAGINIDSDVLKVGHHGSRTASSKEFLSAVSPDIAVISCGRDNSYGHPHEETLSTLNSLSIPYYRTDELGSIIISSNGNKLLY